MTARYKAQRLRNGAVLPSGLDMRPRGMGAPLQPKKGPYRAVVINTFLPDDTENSRGRVVECDVALLRSNIRLAKVPVMQREHGVHNATPWVPRATTGTVSGDTLEAGTPYSDYNGDMVLVDFIEGDSEYPLVLGALTHEQSNRRVVAGTGWEEGDASSRGAPQAGERYLHHRGTELRINEGGDVLIDTVGAYGADDTEEPTTDTGQVRVRVKDGLKFTIECDGVDVLEVYKDSTGVHIDLGEGATEKMVLGSVLKTLYSALTVPTAFGPSGTPLNAASFDTCLSLLHRVK